MEPVGNQTVFEVIRTNCVGERLGRVKEEEKLEISLRNRNCRKQWKIGRMNCVVLRETPFGPLKQRR